MSEGYLVLPILNDHMIHKHTPSYEDVFAYCAVLSYYGFLYSSTLSYLCRRSNNTIGGNLRLGVNVFRCQGGRGEVWRTILDKLCME